MSGLTQSRTGLTCLKSWRELCVAAAACPTRRPQLELPGQDGALQRGVVEVGRVEGVQAERALAHGRLVVAVAVLIRGLLRRRKGPVAEPAAIVAAVVVRQRAAVDGQRAEAADCQLHLAHHGNVCVDRELAAAANDLHT